MEKKIVEEEVKMQEDLEPQDEQDQNVDVDIEDHDPEESEESEVETSSDVESSTTEQAQDDKETSEQQVANEAKKQPRDPRAEQAKRWQREKREFQEQIQELKQKVEKVVPNDLDDIREIAKELGIPEDDARKLNSILDKKLGRLNQPQNNSKEVEKLERKFINEVEDIRDDYDDWEEMGDEMQKAFVEYVQVLNERGKDPLEAFKKGPEFFYHRAKSGKVQSASQALVQGKKEMANKINQKNAASVESSRGNGQKPVSNKWTRERIAKLSVDEYEKHEESINDALRKGLIK